ncbi:MAG: DUF308 domain-containing protein [Solirubrobacterales bacterium]
MEASVEDQLKTFNTVWWIMLILGLISLAFGVFFVASPHETLSTFTVIAGIVLLVEGLLAVLASIFGKGEGRGLLATMGVLSVIAALILIKHPFSALVVFVMIFGIWLVAAGIVRLILAFSDSYGRGVNLILAVIDLAAGIAILVWPDLSLSTLAVIIGIVLIVRGIADIYAAFTLRGALKEVRHDLQGA